MGRRCGGACRRSTPTPFADSNVCGEVLVFVDRWCRYLWAVGCACVRPRPCVCVGGCGRFVSGLSMSVSSRLLVFPAGESVVASNTRCRPIN